MLKKQACNSYIQLWTRDQLKVILDSLTQQVEALEAAAAPAAEAGPKQPHDLPALIEQLQSLSDNFGRAFKTDLKAWVDRVPVVGDNHVLGDLASQVVAVLKALENNAGSSEAIRESVTGIKSRLHQLRANED